MSIFKDRSVSAFADDLMTIVCHNAEARRLIDIVREWEEKNHFQLNEKPGKSSFLRLVKKGSKKDKHNEIIRGIHI